MRPCRRRFEKGDALATSQRPSLGDTTPEVGHQFEISGRRWTVTDHSSYDNDEGYHVDEWECERQDQKETAYLLREGGNEVGWFFTRPIPLSAITHSGGKPFADLAATMTEPPDALVYRGLAHGLDETTAGRYAEDPGESVQKTTWDYWDAKHEVNLAVERWADGRVECYHGRSIDPTSITVAGGGGPAGAVASLPGGSAVRSAVSSFGASAFASHALGFGGIAALGAVVLVVVFVFGGTGETALTLTLAIAALIVLVVALRGSVRIAGGWMVAMLVLGALFAVWPPLTSLGGLAALLLVPAGLTRWIAMGPRGPHAAPAGAACVAIAVATLAAGLYNYYRFAPFPHSFGQYVLAVGPAPLAGIAAALVAWVVLKTSEAR